MPPDVLELLRARLRALAREWQPPSAPADPDARSGGADGRRAARPLPGDPGTGWPDEDEAVEGIWEVDADDGDASAGAPSATPGRVVGPGALRALVVALLAVVALAGWWWWTGRPREVTPAPVLVAPGTAVTDGVRTAAAAPAGTPAASGPPASSASPDGPGSSAPAASVAVVVVHVVGTVRRPGVVRLPAGSRVEDAVLAAGGLRPGAPLGPVNLARMLVDGEQVVVGPGAGAVPAGVAVAAPSGGGPGAGPAAVPGSATPSAPLDLNRATQAELEQLPRVGPVLAQRILSWRAEHGGFRSVQQLGDVPGIGDATFAALAPLVRV